MVDCSQIQRIETNGDIGQTTRSTEILQDKVQKKNREYHYGLNKIFKQ